VRLTRLYVGRELRSGISIELPPEAAAHVARVLRARSGDEVVLFNGGGGEFTAVVETVRAGRVTLAVGAGRDVERESPLAVTLIQCVPRGDRMDLIVQKTVELGVTRIVPVVSQRGVVRIDQTQAESKAAHWRAIAVGACEQCGRNRLPRIDAVRPLLDHLGASDPGRSARQSWVLEPDAGPPDRAAWPDRGAPADPSASPDPAAAPDQAVATGRGAVPREVHVAVGPEGGFTPDELEAFRVAGFALIGLGPRVLRTETAAIAVLTWLQAQFGDM
jgi:16S rRNA (uracil1498-N3)-methyltransferase